MLVAKEIWMKLQIFNKFKKKKHLKKNLFLIVKEACIARVGVCVPYGPVVYPLRVSF